MASLAGLKTPLEFTADAVRSSGSVQLQQHLATAGHFRSDNRSVPQPHCANHLPINVGHVEVVDRAWHTLHTVTCCHQLDKRCMVNQVAVKNDTLDVFLGVKTVSYRAGKIFRAGARFRSGMGDKDRR